MWFFSLFYISCRSWVVVVFVVHVVSNFTWIFFCNNPVAILTWSDGYFSSSVLTVVLSLNLRHCPLGVWDSIELNWHLWLRLLTIPTSRLASGHQSDQSDRHGRQSATIRSYFIHNLLVSSLYWVRWVVDLLDQVKSEVSKAVCYAFHCCIVAWVTGELVRTWGPRVRLALHSPRQSDKPSFCIIIIHRRCWSCTDYRLHKFSQFFTLHHTSL